MATIFPFEPNWSEQVTVEREYKTEIIESRDLTEQRKALRQEPRRKFTFAVQTTQKRAFDSWAYLNDRAQAAFVFVDPTRTATLGAAASAGAMTMNIPGASTISWLKAGAQIVVGSVAQPLLPKMNYSVPIDANWKYKVEPSGSVEDYSGAAYDDSTWDEAPGGFGEAFDANTPEAGTYVSAGEAGKSIWIRFTLPQGPSDEGFLITLWHDDGPELWVDGVSVPLNVGSFRTTVFIPATGAEQVVAYKVTDSVPSGNPTYIYAGVAYEATILGREIVEVQSVVGNTVTTTTALLQDRAIGTLIRPPVYGRLDQNLQGRMETLDSGGWSITFIEDPNEEYRETYLSAPDDQWFDGREVWLRKPNWLEPAQPGVQGFLETLMMDRGVFSHRNQQPFNLRLWSATYTSLSQDRAEEIIQFVHRIRGRRKSFWMPTFKRDIVLLSDVFAGNSIILAKGSETFYRNAAGKMSNRIAVLLRDGSFEFHKIESMSLIGDNTSITLRDPVGTALTGSTVDRISVMPLWRLATDTLSMDWPISRAADAKMSIQQVVIDEAYDGLYPIESFVDAGNATYDLRGYSFISTGGIIGRVKLDWQRIATKISDGLAATATLRVRVECLGPTTATTISDTTVETTGDGLIILDDFVDIPAGTNYARLTFTTIAAVPADTTYSASSQTVAFRGKP